MKYKEIFFDSWNELCELVRTGEFTPHQEQDIVCMMYHLCIGTLKNPKLIHASSTWNFDLVLGNIKGEKRREQKFTHCLLAEFKFILKRGRKNRRLEKSKGDLVKLSEEGDPTTRRMLAILAKANWIEPEEKKELIQYKKNVTVLFYP